MTERRATSHTASPAGAHVWFSYAYAWRFS
ncbi:MAG: hypothetical protein QOI91_1958 [Solirubrobacteraceae bacterium]|jgi:hypothetical protein|nr:hypothetical protein [Solirubrobacteraceae bacterium]